MGPATEGTQALFLGVHRLPQCIDSCSRASERGPQGIAIMLPGGTGKRTFRQSSVADEMQAHGYDRRIDLSSSRAGAVPGTHEIGFDSLGDTITLRHTARSREGFARGALQAARWVVGKQGFFEFREILGELCDEVGVGREIAIASGKPAPSKF